MVFYLINWGLKKLYFLFTFVELDWQERIVENMLTFPKSYCTLADLVYQCGMRVLLNRGLVIYFLCSAI
jgi:hypothetical protein